RDRLLLVRPPAVADAVGPQPLLGQRRQDRPRRQHDLAVAVERAAQVVRGQHAAGPAQHLCAGVVVAELAVAVHQSHTPSTIPRAGDPFAFTSPGAAAPSEVTITASAVPAPRPSMASTGSPSSLPSAVSGCTSSSFQPRRLGCLTVETAWPTTRPICMG